MRILSVIVAMTVFFLFGTQAQAFMGSLNSTKTSAYQLVKGKGGRKGKSNKGGVSSKMQWKETRDENRKIRKETQTEKRAEWKKMRDEGEEDWQEKMKDSQKEMKQERKRLRKEWQGEKDEKLKTDTGDEGADDEPAETPSEDQDPAEE